ncbi:MAG TPA: hypothetical protein VNN73_02055 [Blastocatellia bacterium]|nr:hypothetical protein [Blastocatellia bacterium]
MRFISIITMLVVVSPATGAQSRATRPHAQTKQPAATQTSNQSLPIRRVILYSNGIAYFERCAVVSGHAEINLPFKQSQVDDVLKSMLVLDLGRGRIVTVSYNSSAPPSARLNEIPFSISAATDGEKGEDGDDERSNASGLAGVLRQLQGARVVVASANRTAQGAILTIEERKSQLEANKPPVVKQSLVVASEGGEISSFDLAEIRSIKLLDEVARNDINDFADASASARRRDAKTISITTDGAGERELMVSYTVAAPIWKTTYRTVIDASGKAFFQGWAIVDNVGNEDWTDVQLSLVSGTPVSFIQPIQQPLYRYRPVIPIPEDLALEPQVYEPGTGYNMGGGDPAIGGSVAGGVGMGDGSGGGYGSSSGIAKGALPASSLTGPTTSLSDAIKSEDVGIKTAATGSEIGDLFEYRIEQPVTVARNRSALIPILQTNMEAERVSIYNEAARRDRPMSGLRLKNTSPLTLEGGSLTVLDGDAYAGEALIERLKPGEERFISFAVDLAMLITARSNADRQPAFLARVVNGVFQAHYFQTETKTYTITNQTDKPRALYIEHPIRRDWSLAPGIAKPVEKTASVYRFRLEIKPRETVEFPITERRALMDSYAISNITPKEIEMFVSRRYIDEATRASLEKILEIKSKIAAVDAQMKEADREAAEIAADQSRLRENIKALSEKSEARQLISLYITKAQEQETRLEQLAIERRQSSNERARFQTELDEAIRALTLDRKLE